MDSQAIKEYLSELYNPDFPRDETGGLYPFAAETYKAELEQKRVGFIAAAIELNETERNALKGELMSVKKAIEERGFVNQDPRNLAKLIGSGHREFIPMQYMRTIDCILMSSLLKALSFFERKETARELTSNVVSEGKEGKDVRVLSGTEGLAEFLGCGKTKAFQIIHSNVLKDAGIQYKVGNCWKFNAEKLEKYLIEHPENLK